MALVEVFVIFQAGDEIDPRLDHFSFDRPGGFGRNLRRDWQAKPRSLANFGKTTALTYQRWDAIQKSLSSHPSGGLVPKRRRQENSSCGVDLFGLRKGLGKHQVLVTAEIETGSQAGLDQAPRRTTGLDEQDREVWTLEADLFGQAGDKHQAFFGRRVDHGGEDWI